MDGSELHVPLKGGYVAMTRMDLSPLFRSMVGFDRLFRLLDSAAEFNESAVSYPPYNIEKLDADHYRITMAVAGFNIEDLEVERRENALIVTGKNGQEDDQHRAYLYRGIAGRLFKRTFRVADYVKVDGAHLENGLLEIDLVRELPEAMRARQIKIELSGPAKFVRKAKELVGNVSNAT
jgi:molecular chaperone IbpA